MATASTLTSDELNFLIYRYLLESGARDASFLRRFARKNGAPIRVATLAIAADSLVTPVAFTATRAPPGLS